MPDPSLIIAGVIGGAAAEAGKFARAVLGGADNLPHKKRPFAYCIVIVILAFSGGALVWAHISGGATLTTILALNVGITGPLIMYTAADRARHYTRPHVD